MRRGLVVGDVAAWYAVNARSLPWRAEGVTPWGVLVSEFMLQQTPVARVLPVWDAWLARWPNPGALAAESAGEAVRAWGRLGYPRRAHRLHGAASRIVSEHGGMVPADVTALRALPGVGEYTAAAVASFGFGRRHAVLDTNVRRVLARIDGGEAFPPASLGRGERERADRWLPDDPSDAAVWAASAMELGALICTADRPACGRCPVSAHCRWLAAGRPEWSGPARRRQAYAGTDRQCRGILLAALREADAGVPEATLLGLWPADPEQARRALASLLADGLVRPDAEGRLAL